MPIIGIDLGTSNSAAAVLYDGPRVLGGGWIRETALRQCAPSGPRRMAIRRWFDRVGISNPSPGYQLF